MSPTFDVLTPMTNGTIAKQTVEGCVYYRETWVDRNQDARIGESEIQEFKGTHGTLYKAMRKEYGRCVGHVFVDIKDEREPMKVGWVFIQRVHYDERASWGHQMTKKNSYVRETWITCYEGPVVVIHPKKVRVA